MNKKISILVVDDDVEYAKKLVAFAKLQDYILDADYATDGEKGIELVSVNTPDIIILDSFMPKLDGLGFLRKINRLSFAAKPIIIMSCEANYTCLISAALQNGADYFMLKPQSCSEICQTALELTSPANTPAIKAEENTDSLERRISVFLHSLGIPSHLSGYKYMRFAMLKTINDADLLNPITKKLYPLIAENFNTTKECVERAIRHAIGVSWQRGNKKQIQDIFGYTIDTPCSHCPTNSEYIAMTTDDFRLRLKHGLLD